MILAYFHLLVADGPLPLPELDRRVEAWLGETLNVRADFDVRDAVDKLLRMGMATEGPEGLTVIDLDAAMARTSRIWADLADAD